MADDTPWSRAFTVLKYGKWGLGLFALNYYGWLIDTLFFVVLGVVVVAVVADRIRTRRVLRQWDSHCQDIADQWATAQRATVTPLPAPEPEQRGAA